MTAATHGGRFLLRQPPLGHGAYVPVFPLEQGHGARGRRETLWRTKQKAATGRHGLGEIRDAGSTLLLAYKYAFEVLEFLAISADLVAGCRFAIRIAQIGLVPGSDELSGCRVSMFAHHEQYLLLRIVHPRAGRDCGGSIL